MIPAFSLDTSLLPTFSKDKAMPISDYQLCKTNLVFYFGSLHGNDEHVCYRYGNAEIDKNNGSRRAQLLPEKERDKQGDHYSYQRQKTANYRDPGESGTVAGICYLELNSNRQRSKKKGKGQNKMLMYGFPFERIYLA